MDFGQLLHTAHKNDKNDRKEVRYYKTKFEPPKKEKRSKELSVNVKRFLERKEAEERQRQLEAHKKREELLALRAQDKKATRRVNVMLKRTKSANQSVIQDAVDDDNTAVTLAGPAQPDEDDYGYVSQEASAYYNKMMEKYSKMPDEKKFDFTKKKVSTNLSSTKDRVRAALEREKEEANMPRKRKRKHKESEDGGGDDSKEDKYYSREEDRADRTPPPKPKPRPPPPTMNFMELLKIAEKKQHEPIVIEKKEKEDEKLLTKKQKKEMEREREWRERKEARMKQDTERIPNTNGAINRIPKLNSSSHPSAKPPQNRPIPGSSKISDISRKPELNSHDKSKPSILNKALTSNKSVPSSSSSNSYKEPINNSKPNSLNSSTKISSTSKNSVDIKNREMKPNNSKSSSSNHMDKMRDPKCKRPDDQKRPLQPNGSQPKRISDMQPKRFPPDDVRPKKFPPDDVRAKKFPPDDVRPKKFPPEDVRPKKFPPSDVRGRPMSSNHPKQFPPPDVRGLPPRGMKKKPPIVKGRILDDDDSEYDSEMDDFIDDGPEEENDYSKYISEIFGYDKSRYKHMDDDDLNMESSFAQQMKEEVRSTKIGIMEDLEDMKMEEEHKKKKALMKKRRL